MVRAAHQEITREWWRDAPEKFDLVASAFVVAEARAGDPDAARTRLAALEFVPLLDATSEAESLANALVGAGAVPRQVADDAAHIAIAVTNGADFLVAWNFRHFANAAMRASIEQACRQAGFEPPVICTPNELMEVDNEQEQEPVDPIISEVRAVRDAHAARFDYNLTAIFRDIRAMQKMSKREYVRLPARTIAPSDGSTASSTRNPSR